MAGKFVSGPSAFRAVAGEPSCELSSLPLPRWQCLRASPRKKVETVVGAVTLAGAASARALGSWYLLLYLVARRAYCTHSGLREFPTWHPFGCEFQTPVEYRGRIVAATLAESSTIRNVRSLLEMRWPSKARICAVSCIESTTRDPESLASYQSYSSRAKPPE